MLRTAIAFTFLGIGVAYLAALVLIMCATPAIAVMVLLGLF